MQLRYACVSILEQLELVLSQVSDDDFIKPSPALSNVTVGQHLRHTIEFFFCLESGFRTGTINYDQRNHDREIETNRSLALAALERIKGFVAEWEQDKSLNLEAGYERHSEKSILVTTTYYRELMYNIEHAIHHMALMKVGIREIAPYVALPQNFGIAISTLRYADLVRVS
jgi:uncharacterized damage-inducible protein DinB